MTCGMAWFEENEDGYDEDTILEGYELVRKTVNRWKKGKHLTKTGEIINIEDMDTRHIINTIRLFGSEYNVEPLCKELEARGFYTFIRGK